MPCLRVSQAKARSWKRKTEHQGRCRDYNLSSQERIVRGRMPTMEIVNERFSRNLRLGLFNFIRRSPEIAVGAVQVQKYSAFLRDMVVPTNINIMAVRPLRGNCVVVCEPTLLFGVIDSLYGGNGKFRTRIEGRDFSPTEQRVINRLVDVVVRGIQKGLARCVPAGAGLPAIGDAAPVCQHRHTQRDRGLHQLHAGDRRDLGLAAHLHSLRHPGTHSRRSVLQRPGRCDGSGPPLDQAAEP